MKPAILQLCFALGLTISLIGARSQAQFWAQPSSAEEPNKAYGDAGEPRSQPPAGRNATLGGSGETGTDSVGIFPARDTDFDRKTWNDTQFDLVYR